MFWGCFGLRPRARAHREFRATSNPEGEAQPQRSIGNGVVSGQTSRQQVSRPESAQICHPVAQQVGASRSSSDDAGNTSGIMEGLSHNGSGRMAQVTKPRTNANASRLRQMDPEDVDLCDARNLVEGLRLRNKELGRGSYGVVVPGTYRGTPCAVKVMLSAGVDRAAVRELLLGPALAHPNIIRTYAARCAPLTDEFFNFLEGGNCVDRDPTLPRILGPIPLNSGEGFGDPTGVEDGSDPMEVLHNLLHTLGAETSMVAVLVIQEHCALGNLDAAVHSNLFKGNRKCPAKLARRAMVRTATEVARGLLHLHDAEVVHGDIKPANILLATSNEDRRGFVAKVADFGLSHVLPQAATSISTEVTGSLAYMAPEAFNGKQSRATDVWSFGVTLWEMLTAKRPYADLPYTPAEITRRVQDGSVNLAWPEGPEEAAISALGRRCMSRNPADRPPFLHVVEELVGIERAMRAETIRANIAAQEARDQAEAAVREGAVDTRGSSQGAAYRMSGGVVRGGGVGGAEDGLVVRDVALL